MNIVRRMLSILLVVLGTAVVGLGGELRAVNRIEQRISEAAKLGFQEIYVSKFNQKSTENRNISIKSFGNLKDVFEDLFG